MPARCSPTPRALYFHVHTTPLLSHRYVYMMLLDKLGEVDGGARLLGGALLSCARTTRTGGIIADKHFGRARDVVRVPFGTRALQEAKEGGGEEGLRGCWRGGQGRARADPLPRWHGTARG